MATIFDLQDRGLRYGVIVDAAATTATLAAIERAGLRYKVEVASGITAADRAILDRRGLQYFVPVAATVSMADRAILDRQGLRYAVQADATVLPADLAILERQGLSYFVEADSSGNSVATAAGGAILLADETNGFATDFTHAVDAERVAVKTAGTVVSSTVDGFFTNSGTSPKMVYDVSGVLAWSPHNMCLQSQTFDTASWGKNALAVTANAIAAPDGTTTAEACVPPAGTQSPYVTQAMTVINGSAYTFSIYIKNGTLGTPWVEIQIGSGANSIAWFNLSTGLKGITSGGTISSNMVVLTNGWYRCDATFTAGATSAQVYVAIHSTEGGGAITIGDGVKPAYYLWGAQFNRGTVPTAYLPTTTAARYGLAVDYDPATHAPLGLLCEKAATNLILNNASMSTQSVTVTAVAHTLSIFGTGTITLTGVSTAGPLVGTGASNRVSLTFTPTAGSLTLTVSGSVTNAQLETGPIATSPIPTFAATATRAADAYSATAASIGTSATAGSWWAEVYLSEGVSDRIILGTNTASVFPLFYNSGGYQVRDSTTLAKLGSTLNSVQKAISTFQAGDRAITFNGLAPATDAGVVTNLLGTTTVNFGHQSSNTGMTGWIRKVRYLPRRPSNAEMQTMTT